MSVSLVIRCYNEEKYIGRLLSGIAQQTMEDEDKFTLKQGSRLMALSPLVSAPISRAATGNFWTEGQ